MAHRGPRPGAPAPRRSGPRPPQRGALPDPHDVGRAPARPPARHPRPPRRLGRPRREELGRGRPKELGRSRSAAPPTTSAPSGRTRFPAVTGSPSPRATPYGAAPTTTGPAAEKGRTSSTGTGPSSASSPTTGGSRSRGAPRSAGTTPPTCPRGPPRTRSRAGPVAGYAMTIAASQEVIRSEKCRPPRPAGGLRTWISVVSSRSTTSSAWARANTSASIRRRRAARSGTARPRSVRRGRCRTGLHRLALPAPSPPRRGSGLEDQMCPSLSDPLQHADPTGNSWRSTSSKSSGSRFAPSRSSVDALCARGCSPIDRDE